MIRETLSAAARRVIAWTGQPLIETLNPPPPPPPDPRDSVIRLLGRELANIKVDDNTVRAMERQEYREFVHELYEARALRGSGPWLQSDPTALTGTDVKAK